MLKVNPESIGLDKQLWKDYLNAFGTEAGKRVLEDLKGRFFYYQTTYTNKDDFAPNEGSRRVILTIETILNSRFESKTSEGGSHDDG